MSIINPFQTVKSCHKEMPSEIRLEFTETQPEIELCDGEQDYNIPLPLKVKSLQNFLRVHKHLVSTSKSSFTCTLKIGFHQPTWLLVVLC